MVKVNEILNLDLFSNFRLINKNDGLSKDVGNIVILEYESIINNYAGFCEGDFVISSLFFAKDNESLIREAFHHLVELNVAAIAVKTIFFDTIPDDVINMCNASNIPVFTFNNAYMEDLIVCVNDLLKGKQQYLIAEEHLNSIINTTPSKHTVEHTAYEINPHFSNNIVSAYITKKELTKDYNWVISCFNRLLYKKYQQLSSYNYSYVKYKNGMVLIYSFKNEETIRDCAGIFLNILKKLDINPELFHIGISSIHSSLSELNLCITESVNANMICHNKDIQYMYYDNCGFYKYIFAYNTNESFKILYNKIINIITEYDNQYSSSLLDTLIAYVNNNGEINITAKTLFQHPNTVRYRIKKVKELLNDIVDEASFYEEIFIIIRYYELYDISTQA